MGLVEALKKAPADIALVVPSVVAELAEDLVSLEYVAANIKLLVYLGGDLPQSIGDRGMFSLILTYERLVRLLRCNSLMVLPGPFPCLVHSLPDGISTNPHSLPQSQPRSPSAANTAARRSASRTSSGRPS